MTKQNTGIHEIPVWHDGTPPQGQWFRPQAMLNSVVFQVFTETATGRAIITRTSEGYEWEIYTLWNGWARFEQKGFEFQFELAQEAAVSELGRKCRFPNR